MRRLPLLAPEELEEALGYAGDSRWIALCWTGSGDTVWIADERGGMRGNGVGFEAWSKHAAVAPVLAELDLGSSEREGQDRLLLDRRSREVFATTAGHARDFLRRRWPGGEPLTSSEGERRSASAPERSVPTQDEVLAAMQSHAAAVAAMLRRLDEQLRA